ncbi:MAG: acyl-homoserine-lactone synthase [Pseudomonadota bacterium]
MRVHVVTAANRALYLDEIEAMHRHRYQIFVEERGWRALESADGLDIDEFDNEDATYLIALDHDGDVAGSARLTPSWRPNMLKTLYPEYCEGPVPSGPGIWEWSRHATPGKRHSLAHNVKAQLHLNLAILEFGLSRGMEQVYGVLEADLMPWTQRLGWKSQLLGPPRAYGEGYAVASISPIEAQHLYELRRQGDVGEAVIIEVPGLSPKRGRLARHWLDFISRMDEADLARALTPTQMLAPAQRSA